MRLHRRTIETLARLICGGVAGYSGCETPDFKYRSSSYLSRFFDDCGLRYRHDGSTRTAWVEQVLIELNEQASTDPALPSEGLVRVIQELMDPAHFRELDRTAAIATLNEYLKRDGLSTFLDERGKVHLRALSGASSSTGHVPKRVWSAAEKGARDELTKYLVEATEDQFIENVLAPLFRQLGFVRISVAGHSDKLLEYGKDLWMKYRLPTGHWVYLGCQVKRDKIDASAAGTGNVTTVLN